MAVLAPVLCVAVLSSTLNHQPPHPSTSENGTRILREGLSQGIMAGRTVSIVSIVSIDSIVSIVSIDSIVSIVSIDSMPVHGSTSMLVLGYNTDNTDNTDNTVNTVNTDTSI